MKVEHIASSLEPQFYKRLVRFLANQKIDVIDVKYSTATLMTQYEEDEPIQYSALILYEDKKENLTNKQELIDKLTEWESKAAKRTFRDTVEGENYWRGRADSYTYAKNLIKEPNIYLERLEV